MRLSGWLFLIFSWTFIIVLMVVSFVAVLKKKR
ncbi:MAG: hypothetical protein BWY49_00452 [Candidatus Omnitrophica bacterium ADurb.Bin314]|nr:MAG: hypothetical protein BWY49_00452 [Candidatus Omnitrophica bacterium ADurb.Bin314]